LKKVKVRKKRNSILRNGKKEISKRSLPVISSPDMLPLLDGNFGWEKFEKFTKQLIKAIYNDHNVKLFGVRGQKQYGIDLIAQDESGNHFYAQNKRYRKFSVAQFKKAKSALMLKDAKTILLLACEASSELRLEVLGDPNWDIWDVNDISDMVFQLENQLRYDLLKRFFGIAWAKACCDYNEFSSIVAPIEFFRKDFDSKKLFNHTVPFVGRDAELSCLERFVSGGHQALILSAPGGVGKSRLLWEFSKNCRDSGWSVLFIRGGMIPIADHFQSINAKKVIFVFDDAHRFNLSPYLVFINALKNLQIKLIFSSRPQGRQRLKLDLIKNSLELSEIQDYEVKKFSIDDAKDLVSKLLPKVEQRHIRPIASLLADSTLVGVLACNLIKRQSVSLSSLSHEEDIKGKIISSFMDESSGKIDSNLSNDLIQKILKYVSAVGPIEYDDGKVESDFISATDEDEGDVNECIADLLFASVIVERGGRLRISPDVLSDSILERACYLKNGAPSNFFKDLFDRTDGRLRNNLLKNVSELDWRKKKGELTSSTLLREFWAEFKEFNGDDLSKLDKKLAVVKTIAYFQPIESYEAVLNSMARLSKISSQDRDYRFDSCIGCIVDICLDIVLAGYNVEEIMVTLWELGKADGVNLNSRPGHPIRRIKDLCSYERNLPIPLYERTLNGLKRIIGAYDPRNDRQDPISMLAGFLAKTGSSTYSEGYNITISPFHISYESTKKIRGEVFELLNRLALSDDLKTSYAAVKVIADAASPAHTMMGLTISEEQSEIWNEEIGNAINLLIDVYKKTSLSLIRVHVKNHLNYKLRWIQLSKYKKVIKHFLAKNPFTTDELRYVPFAFWTYRDLLIKRDFKDYKKTQAEERTVYNDITRRIVAELGAPKKILRYAEDAISELLIVKESIHSLQFSIVLSELVRGVEICDALLENNSNRIELDFSVYLRKVAEQGVELAIDYVHKALALENLAILGSIAESFWWVFEGSDNDSRVETLFDKLFAHTNEDVRLASLRGLRSLIHQDRKTKAIEYLMGAEIGSKREAETLFDLLNPYAIKFHELTDVCLRQLLLKIRDIEDLSDHGLLEFVSECGKRIPLELVDVLLYRVESKRNLEDRFVALPYLGFDRLNLNLSDDELLKVLGKVVIAAQKEDANTFLLPLLFYDLGKSKYDLAINYLTDLIKSDDAEIARIGLDLLKEFGHHIVFTRQEWVRDLLNHGLSEGPQCFDEIRQSLFRLGIPTEKHGIAGQPMPQDVALVDNAATAIAKSVSDHERQFYMELKKYGEREIARTMKENQRFLEK